MIMEIHTKYTKQEIHEYLMYLNCFIALYCFGLLVFYDYRKGCWHRVVCLNYFLW